MDISFEKFKSRKLKVKSVDVSEWLGRGAKMYVRELSAADAMDADARKDGDEGNDAEWFCRCLCDKSGNPAIPKGEAIDPKTTPAGLFKAIVYAAVDLNGLGERGAEGNSQVTDGGSLSG